MLYMLVANYKMIYLLYNSTLFHFLALLLALLLALVLALLLVLQLLKMSTDYNLLDMIALINDLLNRLHKMLYIHRKIVLVLLLALVLDKLTLSYLNSTHYYIYMQFLHHNHYQNMMACIYPYNNNYCYQVLDNQMDTNIHLLTVLHFHYTFHHY